MKTEIQLIAKDGSYNATALYDNGNVIVKKGSLIRSSFAEHIEGGKTAKKYRDDPNYVGNDYITKKDCVFSSPSTAAQFVTGSSRNGLLSWHVDSKTTLKKYLQNI